MSSTWTEDFIYTPVLGDAVAPDGWRGDFGNLLEGAENSNDAFPGCQFFITLNNGGPITQLAVNLTISGRKRHFVAPAYLPGEERSTINRWRQRVKIEFVGDCEPSTFTKGWVYFND